MKPLKYGQYIRRLHNRQGKHRMTLHFLHSKKTIWDLFPMRECSCSLSCIYTVCVNIMSIFQQVSKPVLFVVNGVFSVFAFFCCKRFFIVLLPTCALWNAAIVVNSDEYNNELYVKYGDILYTVYDIYLRVDGYTEIVLRERAGDNV